MPTQARRACRATIVRLLPLHRPFASLVLPVELTRTPTPRPRAHNALEDDTIMQPVASTLVTGAMPVALHRQRATSMSDRARIVVWDNMHTLALRRAHLARLAKLTKMQTQPHRALCATTARTQVVVALRARHVPRERVIRTMMPRLHASRAASASTGWKVSTTLLGQSRRLPRVRYVHLVKPTPMPIARRRASRA